MQDVNFLFLERQKIIIYFIRETRRYKTGFWKTSTQIKIRANIARRNTIRDIPTCNLKLIIKVVWNIMFRYIANINFEVIFFCIYLIQNRIHYMGQPSHSHIPGRQLV